MSTTLAASLPTPSPTRHSSVERPFRTLPGYPMAALVLLLFAGVIALFVQTIRHQEPMLLLPMFGSLILAITLSVGLFVVEPNVGRVLVLFGSYRGTVRDPGFHWTNPFTNKRRVSLRSHNLNGDTLKVNDLLGNPIEIAAVVVWRVRDTAQASFDVENFDHFVEVQSESALRLIASQHPYDDGQAADIGTTLRGSSDVIATELQEELRHRLSIAGIEVQEARLSHLAYAPEIAAAMLQRQQAAAIIAARKLIVEGAVGMVEMALVQLGDKRVVELDAERRATLVGNLLVVLCGQTAPTPVVNTGSLYT